MGLNEAISNHLQGMGGMNALAVRRYLAEILKDRYPRNQDIIERIIPAIVTHRDLQDLGRLIADLYETGFLKAVEDYRHLVQSKGGEVKVTGPKQAEERQSIFTPRSQEPREKGRS